MNGEIASREARGCDACDACEVLPEIWYCGADDAFLCRRCDDSVHSANPVARRHSRLRIKNSSNYASISSSAAANIPTWHLGVTRKARTPRRRVSEKSGSVVPDLESVADENATAFREYGESVVPIADVDEDVDLSVFAADMETLLGNVYHDDDPVNVFQLEDDDRYDEVPVVDCEELMKAEEVPTEADEKRAMLKLVGHEDIIVAWSSSCQGLSPWTDGERPNINHEAYWPGFELCGGSEAPIYFQGKPTGAAMIACYGGGGHSGREARVTRYREKRRTRLFSKKIRYEVRKLNAEKRPRVKGRFVKPTLTPTAAATAAFSFSNRQSR